MSIVESIGMNWSGQEQRVKRDPILSEGICVMHTPFGPGRDSMRKMARAALEIVGQSAAIKAVDRFRLLFVADSDPAVLTAEVDPNEMANAYSELEAELSAFRRSVPAPREE